MQLCMHYLNYDNCAEEMSFLIYPHLYSPPLHFNSHSLCKLITHVLSCKSIAVKLTISSPSVFVPFVKCLVDSSIRGMAASLCLASGVHCEALDNTIWLEWQWATSELRFQKVMYAYTFFSL